MKVLKYKQGQERGPLIETSDFENSIFKEQYIQALNIINEFLVSENHQDNSLKCVAFCGERGEGKTSCMSSVREMLTSYQDQDSSSRKFINKIGCPKLLESKAAVIDIIDPAFFDETHNVLEIVIGQLYNKYKAYEKNTAELRQRIELKNKLLEEFTNVNSSLQAMGEEYYESINSLHKLSVLATNIRLREQISSLVKVYLEYIGVDFLIIPIDDIDINVVHAYKMCEQIRKYLCVPNCFLLISFKIEQLQDVVAQAMLRSIGSSDNPSSFFSRGKIIEMAKKYINKFIPVTSRVEMPKGYDLVDVALREQTPYKTPKDFDSLKKSIVQLIFSRTRYLFYNPFDGVSPIVPNNLRDIVNLLGLLFSMEEVPNSRDFNKFEILLANKHQFKYFFYSVWKNQFDSKTQENIDALIHFDFGTSFNREVIALLWNRFDKYLKKDYSTPDNDDIKPPTENDESILPNKIQDSELKKYLDRLKINRSISIESSNSAEMLQGIVDTRNFGYNLTIGDVFYIFSFLESETLSEAEYALIFFLKSLYSIKLYETYEAITEGNGRIYPNEDKDRAGLSIIDHRFDSSNKLQQLIGGSYFTYCPGYLIPGGNSIPLDLRIISGKTLYDLLSKLKNDYLQIKHIISKTKNNQVEEENDDAVTKISNEEKKKVSEFFEDLNVVEFFILTIPCAVSQKYTTAATDNMEVIRALNLLRRNVTPFHYAPFASNTGFYLFDITGPFSNLVNPEYSYCRFDSIDKEFFDFIKVSEDSLLNKILTACSSGRRYIHHAEDDEWTKLHRLLSDCVIRNAEVLTSIRNNMLTRRQKTHDSRWVNFYGFYKNFNSSEMKTQPTSLSSDPEYIAFNFLKPLDDFLKKIDEKSDILNKRMRRQFFSIFDSRLPKTNETATETQIKFAPTSLALITKEDINKIIGRSKKPDAIRNKLKGHTAFSYLSEIELKKIIPDLVEGVMYVPEDAKEIVWQWVQQQTNDKPNNN